MDDLKKVKKVYSEAFKQMVVNEVSAGLSVPYVSSKYEIGGGLTVYKWCKMYDVIPTTKIIVDVPLDYQLDLEMAKDKPKVISTKDSDRIKLLEYELALYKKLVEIAKRDYNLDLVKKSDTKPFKK